MQAINDFILAAAGQPWVLVLVLACCVIDGFFPPIPSESVVVGLAAVAVTADVPAPLSLIGTAAAGAFIGDNIAYLIGRGVGTSRWAVDARSADAEGLPLGRHGTAEAAGVADPRGPLHPDRQGGREPDRGRHGFSAARFVALTVLSAVLWAGYSVGIGMFFGQWFEQNHLLGATIAIVCAIVLGILVDVVIRKLRGPLPVEPAVAVPPGDPL